MKQSFCRLGWQIVFNPLQSNQKKFVEHVTSINLEKINKLISKGLDPNFHCQDSGGKILFDRVQVASSAQVIQSKKIKYYL